MDIEWISTDDALPENDNKVIVCFKYYWWFDRDKNIPKYKVGMGRFSVATNSWIIVNEHGWRDPQVTHWLPYALPEFLMESDEE